MDVMGRGGVQAGVIWSWYLFRSESSHVTEIIYGFTVHMDYLRFSSLLPFCETTSLEFCFLKIHIDSIFLYRILVLLLGTKRIFSSKTIFICENLPVRVCCFSWWVLIFQVMMMFHICKHCIKIFTPFSLNIIDIFISCDENILSFILASHSWKCKVCIIWG